MYLELDKHFFKSSSPASLCLTLGLSFNPNSFKISFYHRKVTPGLANSNGEFLGIFKGRVALPSFALLASPKELELGGSHVGQSSRSFG